LVRFTWNFTAGIATVARIEMIVTTMINSISVTPSSPALREERRSSDNRPLIDAFTKRLALVRNLTNCYFTWITACVGTLGTAA
jgi:hypothetical protein